MFRLEPAFAVAHNDCVHTNQVWWLCPRRHSCLHQLHFLHTRSSHSNFFGALFSPSTCFCKRENFNCFRKKSFESRRNGKLCSILLGRLESCKKQICQTLNNKKSRNEQSTSKSFIFRCWKKFSGDENASSWVFRTLRPWDCRNGSSSAAPWHASLKRQLDNGTRKAVQSESIQRITQSARDFFLVHRQLHHFCFDLLKQKAKT